MIALDDAALARLVAGNVPRKDRRDWLIEVASKLEAAAR
jgi:hypothetical protein